MDTIKLAASIGDAPNESIALIDGSNRITYGQLRDGVARTAGGLLEAGLTVGDRVVILSGNDPAFVESLLACWHAGLVAVPLNYNEPSLRLDEYIAARHAKAVLHGTSQTSMDAVSAITTSGLSAIGTPATIDTPDAPSIDGQPTSIAVDGDQPALIVHTSGVSSRPRPALLTHKNLSATQASLDSLPETALHQGTVSLGALPFVHILGMNVSLLATLAAGGTTVLQNQWSAHLAMALVSEHRVNTMVLVPTMWSDLAAISDVDEEALANVTLARSGAAELHQSVAMAVNNRLGIRLGQGYGLTETAGTVSYEPDALARPGSVGRPLGHVQLRVIDGGRDAEPGDSGEIWIRGDCVFAGYDDDDSDTHMTDGWLRTGDLGVMDDTLYIVGRLKDIISVSGFKISPLEVEEVLCLDQGVRNAMVMGEPDPRTGERVVAYVVPSEGPLNVDELQNHVRTHLARYKVPKEVYLVDALPQSSMIGKPLRGQRPTPIGSS